MKLRKWNREIGKGGWKFAELTFSNGAAELLVLENIADIGDLIVRKFGGSRCLERKSGSCNLSHGIFIELATGAARLDNLLETGNRVGVIHVDRSNLRHLMKNELQILGKKV
jgi:hypothetical protein